MSGNKRRRRAYFLSCALFAAAILSYMAVALSRYAALHVLRERTADAEALADQVVLSARQWSRMHVDRTASGETIELPVERLVPSGVSGTAQVSSRQTSNGQNQVACRVTLHRGRVNLTRQATWPLPAPHATGGPGPTP